MLINIVSCTPSAVHIFSIKQNIILRFKRHNCNDARPINIALLISLSYRLKNNHKNPSISYRSKR